MVSGYRVTATHDGHAWDVRIEDADGAPVGGARTAGLDEVDEAARLTIAGQADERPEEVTMDIDIRLAPELQARLDRIEQLRRDTDRELEAVEHDLNDAGMSTRDVGALLSDTVSNQEIAAHGLRRHPQAIAVRFDDKGRFTTTTCRACLDRDRADYAELPAEGLNTLIVRGPLMCDVCFEDIPDRA